MTLRLNPREAHVWWFRFDAARARLLLDVHGPVLSVEEKARYARFRVERPAREFAVGRIVLRKVLSHYAPEVEPSAWGIRIAEYGRPEVATPAYARALRFNLSHTDGLVACVVAVDRDVGVDVEGVLRLPATDAIARRYFSPVEAQALAGLPLAARQARFFEYWTLKEAYIKARGMGLQLPLEQFSFQLDRGWPIRIAFGPGIDDQPASWQFNLFRPMPGYRLSVAIRRGSGPDLSLVVRGCAESELGELIAHSRSCDRRTSVGSACPGT